MILAQERAKYEDIWGFEPYHEHSPGREYAALFGRLLKPTAHDIVIDFGAGHGEGAKELNRLFGVKTLTQDIVGEQDDNRPLWLPVTLSGTYGYCCDVMEHIPEQFTMLAVANMLAAVDELFLAISFVPDAMGAAIGQDLHLTVKPFRWWYESLSEIAEVTEARDLIGQGVFVVR